MQKIAFVILSALAATPSIAADNPMWKTGFVWQCEFTSTLVCQRASDCGTEAKAGAVKLDYRENRVTDESGADHAIRRHYVQTVVGSPISVEVKVELANNDVLWLSPADAAGTFSDNWIGALLSPKAGVIVQELKPLACKPSG